MCLCRFRASIEKLVEKGNKRRAFIKIYQELKSAIAGAELVHKNCITKLARDQVTPQILMMMTPETRSARRFLCSVRRTEPIVGATKGTSTMGDVAPSWCPPRQAAHDVALVIHGRLPLQPCPRHPLS